MNWFLGGYFGAWYILFGAGLVRWLTEHPDHTESWWIVAFGVVAYTLLIPSLLFGLMEPVLGRITATSADTLEDGLKRRVIGRAGVLALGLVSSVAAMVTCVIVIMFASVSDLLSTEVLGENGLAFAMVSLMMGILTIIAVYPWLGLRFLLAKCQPAPSGRRWLRRASFAAVLVWAALLIVLGYRVVNATRVMTVRLDFAALPPSDEPLRDWLRSQPDLVNAGVTRQGDAVVIEYGVSAFRGQSISRVGDVVTIEATSPKRSVPLTDAAAELGYHGLQNMEVLQSRKQW